MNPNGQLPPQPSTTPPSGGGVPAVEQSSQQSQPYTPDSSPNYSVDYLNQIAPMQHKTVNRFAIIALIGGVLISALFAIILIAGTSGPNVDEQLTPIATRIATLKEVTQTQQAHLKEAKISEANAALNSSLNSMNTDIQTILAERKIKITEKSASSKKEAAYQEKLAKTLEESYQRGTLDQIYTSQMTYELTLLKSNLSKLRRSTKSEVLTGFTESALQNIDTILKAYALSESSET